jgi:hypothetical protein
MLEYWHQELQIGLPNLMVTFFPALGPIQGCKDQRWLSLCIFRTLPGLNVSVIGNCTVRNVAGAFHILEGTVLKLSNLSFAYLHRFSHFFQFLSLSIQGIGKKKHRWSLHRGRFFFSDKTLLLCIKFSLY